MTLVVARIFDDRVALLGDSYISDVTRSSPSATDGALKIWSMSRTLAVAYAGAAELAVAALARQQDALAAADGETAATLLHAEHRRTSGAVSFIVVSLRGTTPSIWLIDGDAVHSGLQTAHIGDTASFSVLQGLFHGDAPLTESAPPTAVPADLGPHELFMSGMTFHLGRLAEENANVSEAFVRFLDAFKLLVDSQLRRNAGVGGFAVMCVRVADRLEYLDRADVFSGPLRLAAPAPGESLTIPFGELPLGAFSRAVFTPDAPGVPAVAAYFPHARFGALYAPLLQHDVSQPLKFMGVTSAELVQQIKAEHGLDLGGPIVGVI